MKVLFFLVALSVSSLFADLTWATSYTKAFVTAKEQNKDVFVILTQEDCRACWYMENIVFEDEVLAETLSKQYVTLMLDVHDDDIQGLDYRGTPTLYFLTNEDKVIKRLDGVYNIKELTAALLRVAELKEEMEEAAQE